MAGTKAHLSKIFVSDDDGVTYTKISNCTQVQKPTSSKSDIDMSDLDSVAMEFEQDIPDYGSPSYAFNFDGTDTVHQGLLVDEASNAIKKYKVELPERSVATVTTFIYDATVSSVDIDSSRGGKQDGTLNLRVTGPLATAHGATAEA